MSGESSPPSGVELSELESNDPELERYTQRLRRQTAGLAIYLRIRALLGLLLMGVAAVAMTLAACFALSGLGVLSSELLSPWTTGFNAVLATFMPAALGWMSGKAGMGWWRHRHPQDPDPGCPSC